MVVKCTKCGKKYKIDESKITDKGAKITCPSCQNIFIVKKKPEEENVIPCSKCGEPASFALDTEIPLCENCKSKEEETAARFAVVDEDHERSRMFDRELDLKSSRDTSFGDLTTGDFSDKAYSTEVLPGQGQDYVPPPSSLGKLNPDMQLQPQEPGPDQFSHQTPTPPPQYPEAIPSQHPKPPPANPVNTVAPQPAKSPPPAQPKPKPAEPPSFIESPHETAASLPAEQSNRFVELHSDDSDLSADSFVESPHETAASLPTEQSDRSVELHSDDSDLSADSFVESPHETAASLPTEQSDRSVELHSDGSDLSADSFIESPHETAASLPTDTSQPPPPVPPQRLSIPSEPTPPPVSAKAVVPPRPPTTPTPQAANKTPPPMPPSIPSFSKSTAPKPEPSELPTPRKPKQSVQGPATKGSPAPLIITLALLGAIVAYVVFKLMLKDFF